jgi:lactoylglutathione lyase
LAKAAHTMIRVLEEQRSVDFYKAAFDLDVVGRFPFDGFTLLYLGNAESGFELELTVNASRTAPYDLGNGYGHFAVVVDDIAAEHARFVELGFSPKPIVEFLREGAMFARFFFVDDPDGYKIEVLQKSGRFM